jgi:UDP-N-acetylglucosamine 4,6-dehydratase
MTGVLITGGAGTLGREIARQLHLDHPSLRIVIYSRDEGKQAAMRAELPEGGADGLRYMLGDIRDYPRLLTAMEKCDTVVHAAAMKMIDTCEYDAWEAVSVNVVGTQSVARACKEAGVRRALFVSTDKAPDPVSVYGKTKSIGESVWLHGNTISQTEFVAVRYGNVVGSAKSVFHRWKAQAQAGEPLTITSADATRFYWSVTAAADFCIRHLTEPVTRGCVYIPRMRSWQIANIARTYSDNVVVTGWRCPEKTHEVLWTEWENDQVRMQDDRYVLYPYSHSWTSDCEMVGIVPTSPVRSNTVLSNIPWTGKL